jgi:endonuclease-3
MSAKNRADLINKLFRVAKKEFDFIKPASNRNVFEHMLYGCCLENSTHEAADETLAKLQENFCDWNEVRVTTVDELAESGKGLGNPKENALSVKQTLYGIFEKYFTYDLEFLKKENLSKSVATFETFRGVKPFVISYVAQNGLGGHSIPIDRSMMSLFYVLGIVTEDEAAKGRVPGLERTIAKSKGVEFFAVVHQLAVAFASTPFSTAVRDKLLKINPNSKERFPKRASKKKAATPEAAPAKPAAEAKPKPAAKKKVTAKTTKATKKKATTKTTKTTKAAKKVVKKKATKKSTKKKAVKKAAKKVTKNKATKKAVKKTTARKKTTKKPAAKKSATKKLSKKKPR